MGAKVAVMGGGTIGMLTAAAAKLAGASFIAMTEPVKERREMAAKFGVDLALPPGDDSVAQIKQAAGGIDAAFEAAGECLEAHIKELVGAILEEPQTETKL